MPHDPPPVFGPAQMYLPSLLGTASVLALSDNNLIAEHTGVGSTWRAANITDRFGSTGLYQITDKRYFEFTFNGPEHMGASIGFVSWANANDGSANPASRQTYMATSNFVGGVHPGLWTDGANGADSQYGTALGATIMVAINGENGHVFFGYQGAWLGSQNPTLDINPALTLPDQDFVGTIASYDGGVIGGPSFFQARLGLDILYPLPTGYRPWARVS